MTREEAKNVLHGMRADNLNLDDAYTKDKYDALSMGINALQQQSCEDCISRQAVLDLLENTNNGWIINKVLQLPPVTPQPKTGRWIPVSERLPKPFSYVNCTCRSLIDDRAFWVVETCYVPQPKNSPYSDWGNIPMLNHGDCAVVAWMYREIPKPYKAESEVQGDEIQGET